MATKNELELAHKAGYRAASTEPPDRRHPDACPFPPGTEERASWLEGFQASLDEAPSQDLRSDLSDAISVNSELKEARVR